MGRVTSSGRTVSEDETVPESDHDCSWVETESDGRDEGVKVNGGVVDCDVQTDKVITVSDDGVIIGNTDSNTKSIDADDATVEGDVHVDAGDFDCTDSTVDGQDCSAYSPKDADDY